jgi:FMN phosphatase YigB (HAD superfamily)
MIQALLLDWHGVLDFTTFEQLASLIARESNRPIDDIKKIFKSIKTSMISGNSDSSLLWTEITDKLKLSDSQLKSIKQYRLKIDKNQALFDYLDSIKEKYKLSILSDCPLEKAEMIRNTIDLGLFNPVVFSCDTGQTKSDDAFFVDSVRLLGVKISEVLYVDDTEKHIKKAKALGFQTHHFKNTHEFIAHVQSLE